jgi:hypothetical protein
MLLNNRIGPRRFDNLVRSKTPLYPRMGDFFNAARFPNARCGDRTRRLYNNAEACDAAFERAWNEPIYDGKWLPLPGFKVTFCEHMRNDWPNYETYGVPGCGEVISTKIIQSYFQFQSEESGQKCRVAIKFDGGRYIDVAMDGKLAADVTVEAYKFVVASEFGCHCCGTKIGDKFRFVKKNGEVVENKPAIAAHFIWDRIDPATAAIVPHKKNGQVLLSSILARDADRCPYDQVRCVVCDAATLAADVSAAMRAAKRKRSAK